MSCVHCRQSHPGLDCLLPSQSVNQGVTPGWSLSRPNRGCINCLETCVSCYMQLAHFPEHARVLLQCPVFPTQQWPRRLESGGVGVQLESTITLPSNTAYQVLKQDSKAPDILLHPPLKLFIGLNAIERSNEPHQLLALLVERPGWGGVLLPRASGTLAHTREWRVVFLKASLDNSNWDTEVVAQSLLPTHESQMCVKAQTRCGVTAASRVGVPHCSVCVCVCVRDCPWRTRPVAPS